MEPTPSTVVTLIPATVKTRFETKTYYVENLAKIFYLYGVVEEKGCKMVYKNSKRMMTHRKSKRVLPRVVSPALHSFSISKTPDHTIFQNISSSSSTASSTFKFNCKFSYSVARCIFSAFVLILNLILDFDSNWTQYYIW
ncbi:hypothetical protein PsorP6_002166 [Peronosclerospora sorghi]|uniref:Uncharacterized protein n=1 Tax=Peronosclerospora sorghi TaxID=230839 RepID=A0ACC0WTF2_9STRA|nr:hypothetical protein PsorP6_002166 [Peronosclerospora sorghi]